MADSKISALTALSAAPAAGDLLVLVDVSDTTMAASGTDKKITYANLTSALVSGATTFATSSAQTFTNGVKSPSIQAISDATTHGWKNAAGTNVLTVDTTNGRVGIGKAPTVPFEVEGASASVLTRTLTSGAGAPDSAIQIGLGGIYTGVNAGGPSFLIFGNNSTPAKAFMGRITAIWENAAAGSEAAAVVINVRANTGDTTASTIAATFTSTRRLGIGSISTPTAAVHSEASTTARASFCAPQGTAPTTPVVGDIWNDGALSFYNADATTNAVVNHLRLRRNSTGTAAAGFGLGIIAELESSTTDAQSAGRLTWEWATATHASRAAKGKLTAYYTSTERDAITWTADSAGATVYVNPAGGGVSVGDTTTPGVSILRLGGTIGGAGGAGLYVDPTTNAAAGTQYGLRILGNPANATDFIGLGIHGSANLTNYRNSIWVGNEAGRPGINIGYDYNVAAPEFGLIMAGKLGVGVSSPQAILHGHDGSGGFLFVNRASVGGTLVTVIPDAAGDVTEKIFFVGWCTNSAPFSADVAPTTLAVSSSTTKTDGTNTLTIAVTAGGAFTLQATGGAATWNVNLWVFWR